MENNLPQGWEFALLSDLVHYRKGKKPKIIRSTPFQGSVPYLDIKAIEKNIEENFADTQTSTITDSYELIMVWDGARAGWVGNSRKGALGSTLMAFKPSIHKSYLYRFLQTQFEYLQSNHRGTGIPHVDPDILWKIEVPVAPWNEQERIVSKLDSLFEKIELNKKRLGRIPQILKRFRQSVLADAVSGRLTEEWRNKNNLESTWIEVTLEDIIEEILAGRSIKCVERPPNIGETGIVKVSAVSWGAFLEDESKTITDTKFYNEKFIIRSGDFLLSRANTSELVGAVVIVKNISRSLMLSDKILRITYTENVLPQWVLYCLRSIDGRQQIEQSATGNQQSMMNISQEKIRGIRIKLPTLIEQQEIIIRMENFLTLADKIEQRYFKTKISIDKLPLSILSKAFRGDLVPQDSNDEPASMLLQRIKAEKSKRK